MFLLKFYNLLEQNILLQKIKYTYMLGENGFLNGFGINKALTCDFYAKQFF